MLGLKIKINLLILSQNQQHYFDIATKRAKEMLIHTAEQLNLKNITIHQKSYYFAGDKVKEIWIDE